MPKAIQVKPDAIVVETREAGKSNGELEARQIQFEVAHVRGRPLWKRREVAKWH